MRESKEDNCEANVDVSAEEKPNVASPIVTEIRLVKSVGQFSSVMLLVIAFVMTALCGTAMTSLFDTEVSDSSPSTRAWFDDIREPDISGEPQDSSTESFYSSRRPAVAQDSSLSVFTIRTKSGVTSGQVKKTDAVGASLFEGSFAPTRAGAPKTSRPESHKSSLFDTIREAADTSRHSNYRSSYSASRTSADPEPNRFFRDQRPKRPPVDSESSLFGSGSETIQTFEPYQAPADSRSHTSLFDSSFEDSKIIISEDDLTRDEETRRLFRSSKPLANNLRVLDKYIQPFIPDSVRTKRPPEGKGEEEFGTSTQASDDLYYVYPPLDEVGKPLRIGEKSSRDDRKKYELVVCHLSNLPFPPEVFLVFPYADKILDSRILQLKELVEKITMKYCDFEVPFSALTKP
jgi:hypothetical protein